MVPHWTRAIIPIEFTVMDVMIPRIFYSPAAVTTVTFEGKDEKTFDGKSKHPQWEEQAHQRRRRKIHCRLKPMHGQTRPRVRVKAFVMNFVHMLVEPFSMKPPMGPIKMPRFKRAQDGPKVVSLHILVMGCLKSQGEMNIYLRIAPQVSNRSTCE